MADDPFSFLVRSFDIERIRAGDTGELADAIRLLRESFNGLLLRVPKTTLLAGNLIDQPLNLTAADSGLEFLVLDFGHRMRWTGSVWEFAAGDCGNNFFRASPSAPQGTGWQLCDGTVTSYLVAGASLTTAPFTTPNIAGNPAYLKGAAAYSGAIQAAIAAAISGSTANASPGTDAQGSHNHGGATGSHTHGLTGLGGPDNLTYTVAFDSGGVSAASNSHKHAGPTDGATASISSDGSHSHTVNAHSHAVGSLVNDATGQPQRLDTLVYYRR